MSNENLPLYMRLALQNARQSDDEDGEVEPQRNYKSHKGRKGDESTEKRKIGRDNKNAPAEMPSNKPVRRLRIDANNTVKKSIDPRFSDFSGNMDEKIFNKNYSFLDDYRQDEIKQLGNVIRKVKSEPKKEAMKTELLQMKQQASERRRSLKVAERIEAFKKEDKEKVKQGKKPFFMKAAAVKAIGLEERFNELKREGKLNKFMNKKRKKNSSKDHRWIPNRRSNDE